MAPASQEARESKRRRQRQRRMKAKLFALSMPCPPKPESVPLPSPPKQESVPLPSEPEEPEDDSSGGIKIKPTERDLESDEVMWALYKRWCLRHGINRTPKEMQRRFSIFKRSAIHVFGLNQKDNPNCRCCMFRRCDEPRGERKRRMPRLFRRNIYARRFGSFGASAGE